MIRMLMMAMMMMDAFRHMSDRVRGGRGLNDVLFGVSPEAETFLSACFLCSLCPPEPDRSTS